MNKVTKNYRCYAATHIDNGLIYVGVTSRTLEQRKQDHKDGAKKRRSRFAEAIKEFSINAFNWCVVAEGTEDVMRLLERFLIYEWDTANPDYGYNEVGGRHPAQIRYQMKKESWKDFGPPWNKPMPQEEVEYLEFEKMMDDQVNILHALQDITEWLKKHRRDQIVEEAIKEGFDLWVYNEPMLRKKRGCYVDVMHILSDIQAWLKRHRDDAFVEGAVKKHFAQDIYGNCK